MRDTASPERGTRPCSMFVSWVRLTLDSVASFSCVIPRALRLARMSAATGTFGPVIVDMTGSVNGTGTVTSQRGGKNNADRKARPGAKNPGRPPGETGPNARTLRRGEYVAIFRSVRFMSDSVILQSLKPGSEADPTKTLDGWEREYRTFSAAAMNLDASDSPALDAYKRGAIKAWELPKATRIRVWASRSADARRPARDRQTRDVARAAYRDLEQSGRRLKEAQRLADAGYVPKVGENQTAQLGVARRSPRRALAWVEAEIDELQHRSAAIRAADGVALPESTAALLSDRVEQRVRGLREWSKTIKAMPAFSAEEQPDVLENLDVSIRERVARVWHRPAEERFERAQALVCGDPHVKKLSHNLVGDRWEDLVTDRLYLAILSAQRLGGVDE
jgi:hypothetical protein